jgi:folate-dependent tRNA-U54 methylase TrmFO/GidA
VGLERGEVMIKQLAMRLGRYKKEYDKNDKEYAEGKMTEEQFYRNRFSINRRLIATYELEQKKIYEQEFTDAQLDMLIDLKH